jgi:hypothetical protein
MSEPDYIYRVGQELPAMTFHWREHLNGAATPTTIDFSTGWTGSVLLCSLDAPDTTLVTISSGITLAATAPNFTVDFTVTAWADLVTAWGKTLPAGIGAIFIARPNVRRNSDSKDRRFRPLEGKQFRLLP